MMLRTISVINPDGDELILELGSPEQSGFFIKSIDGLGPVKAIINHTTPVGIDGIIFNSAKAMNRNIVFNLGFYDNGSFDIETQRQLTYKYFPLKGKVTVYILTDNRYVYATGYVESNEPNIFSKGEDTQISIVCESSSFSDAYNTIEVLNGIENGFEFPWENPSLTEALTEFSSLFVDTQKNIVYTGDVPTGVLITIAFQGAVTNLTIYNTTTGSLMSIDETKVASITGSAFTDGDIVYISTVKGSKSVYLVRGTTTYNIFNALQNTSSWFELQRGDNGFSYAATTGIDNLLFSVTYRALFEGA